MKTKPENPRGLPVVGPWDVLDSAGRSETWVTPALIRRARLLIRHDLDAAIARAEAAEAALAEYANPKNWGDYEGRQRVWIEPDSGTPDAYNGYALAQAAIAAQQAEGEALRADAKRYRWLRESGLAIAWNAQVSYSPGYAEVMDAAIDAEMAAEGRDG